MSERLVARIAKQKLKLGSLKTKEAPKQKNPNEVKSDDITFGPLSSLENSDLLGKSHSTVSLNLGESETLGTPEKLHSHVRNSERNGSQSNPRNRRTKS